MTMRTEQIEGLRRLPEEDLTVEEKEALAVAEAEEEAEEQERISDVELLARAFANKEDGPRVYTIEGWKEQFGVLHVSSIFQEEDLYIWRVLKRQEYKQMSKTGVLNETSRAEEAIVRRCLLYPEPNDSFIYNSPAGVISALKEQIMFRSGFIPDHMIVSQIKVL